MSYMLENLKTSSTKFGPNDNDIKSIYILASNKGKIETVYTLFNDDKIERIDKPTNMLYISFFRLLSKYLKNVGANNSNKNDKWFVTFKKNYRNIDYDALDEKYYSQTSKILNKDNYDIVTVDKYTELDILNDEEAKRKSKIIENIVETGILSLMIVYSSKTDTPISNYKDLLVTLDLFTITSAIFNRCLLDLDRSMMKDTKKDIYKLEKKL